MSTETPLHADPAARARNLRRTAWAGVIGSVIEYYDFTLFGLAAALVFGPLFFPGSDPSTQVINSLLTFAIGYFGRPIGGILFSHFGDRIGRKPMLVLTLMLMGVSTLAIGLLPTYAVVGLWAPVLLAVCRVLQGMGAGAEYVGSLVMMAESGDRRRLGVRVALPGMGVFGGIVIATGVFALIALLPEDALHSWGWRVPFLLSIVTVAIGLWVRTGIHETEEFTALREQGRVVRFPLGQAIRHQWREILIGFGINGPYLAFSSLTQVYLLSYLTGSMGLPASFGLAANLVSSTLAIAVVPLAGWLGDRLGRRQIWLFGCGVFIVFGAIAFPLFATGNEFVIIATMVLGISVGLATMYSTQGAILTALFDPAHRLSAVVIVREPTAALIAGPVPAFAAWLVLSAGGATWPVTVLFVGAALIAGITVILGWKRLARVESR
ncbi:MFS transporter [Microbacterium nymphoidis]|jgi:MFS transporter, MHS family, shikimate and dehydroshikimate transport protein|uniref:MFS transporter n=1 Tax=Microbacterium nymphoidis TaxID=2898586 RepID=UPI001E48438F|nr:MFS transporter [Microbacterium nymphoidis]MCD2499584.1 MFS transporter [Microbacterium nymphoidis]